MTNIVDTLEGIKEHCIEVMKSGKECKENCFFCMEDKECFFGKDLLPYDWETDELT